MTERNEMMTRIVDAIYDAFPTATAEIMELAIQSRYNVDSWDAFKDMVFDIYPAHYAEIVIQAIAWRVQEAA